MSGERFTITLEAVPRDSRPASRRLRGALKTLLRGFGLRCVTINSAQPDAKTKRSGEREIVPRKTQ